MRKARFTKRFPGPRSGWESPTPEARLEQKRNAFAKLLKKNRRNADRIMKQASEDFEAEMERRYDDDKQ